VDGEGQHSGGPAEAHGRASDHPPAIGSDVDGAPMLVGEIEVDVSVALG
jgi:hypothetical protein